MSIDYEKLNDQVVKQAYDASSAFLTEAQRQRLFQNKIDRAAAMIRTQEQFKRLSQEDWSQKCCRQRGPVLHYNLTQKGGPVDRVLLVEQKIPE